MAMAWTKTADEALIAQKRDRKLPWRSVYIDGATVRECQRRLKLLETETLRPSKAPRVIHKGGPNPLEDGLDRLVRKSQLTRPQIAMAKRYRTAARLAQHEAVSVKSCLNDVVGGGGGDLRTRSPELAFQVTAAKRELFVMRHQVLRGQRDVLTVFEGVLENGQTITALAGGQSARGGELLMALRIGLDQLISHYVEHASGAAPAVDQQAA